MASAEDEIDAGGNALGKLDYETAYKHFDKATKADPQNATAFFGKAEASLGLPKMEGEKILEFYLKAVELAPDNPQYLEAYGLFCLDMQRFGDAEKAFNSAADADPDEAPMYWAEFAVQYVQRAPAAMEAKGLNLDEKTMEIIQRKALEYALKSLQLDKETAKKLL